ncbi:hypothetical protein PILCRDRAFT_17333 [Piloderma croceum F 1598]|uniref:Uncharacterized protein n=1 Tax=Piloderma croceum (strain F 1598) TaxID=765440 RepID=A0A0C3EET9_PILCF|nr:hypothetical protein PILCRDRAFT_17333 [Piloderma croceum F 1598]
MLSAFPLVDEDIQLLPSIATIYLPLCNTISCVILTTSPPIPRAADKAEAQANTKKKGGSIQVPEEWPLEEAKKVFEHPDVTPASELELKWKNPDVEGLVQFLVTEKGFNKDHVRKGADKLTKFLNSKQQGRLDGFFTVQPKMSPKKVTAKNSGKDAKGKGKAKVDVKATKRKNDEKEASWSKKTKK